MHYNVAPDALPGSATFVRVMDRWFSDCSRALPMVRIILYTTVVSQKGAYGVVQCTLPYLRFKLGD